MDTVGHLEQHRHSSSSPRSTAEDTSPHHGKSTSFTTHSDVSCITQEQPAPRCARSINAAYATARSRQIAPHAHDTTKNIPTDQYFTTNPHTSRRLHYLNQLQAATRTADASKQSSQAADAGYSRINEATDGGMHHPMSQ